MSAEPDGSKDSTVVRLALAGAALGVLAFSALWTPATLPDLPFCLFRELTGYPCPGCGLTRAFCAISHGRSALAYQSNPFGFVFYALAVYGVLRPALLRFNPQLEERLCRRRLFRLAVVALALAMLSYGVARAAAMARL